MNLSMAWRLVKRWTWLLVIGGAWCLGTVLLGLRAVVRAGVLVARLDDLLAETLRCPRGHRSPVYGVYDCACGSLHEGWVFGRCAVCGQSAGWTPCLECGLSVRNPLRR